MALCAKIVSDMASQQPTIEHPESRGLLSVEVKAPPIVAGTPTTVSLIIRNPFRHPVVIESIQAPSSAPLLPKPANPEGRGSSSYTKDSIWQRIISSLEALQVQEVRIGPLVAEFPQQSGRAIHVNMDPKSKFTVKRPFGPTDSVHINAAEGAEVIFDFPSEETGDESNVRNKERTILPQQEDLASFELQTAHWLLVTPKVLELHALIRYRVGSEPRSQVVPVTLSVQPPLTSIVCGTVSGGVLGWLARQLNADLSLDTLLVSASVISVLGIIVMATILAIVLSRQESSKGFVTLEDFYGAFVVGAILGYVGTEYFETVVNSARSASGT